MFIKLGNSTTLLGETMANENQPKCMNKIYCRSDLDHPCISQSVNLKMMN